MLVAGLVTWLLWPSRPAGQQPARERHYRSTTVCLLTDDKGVEGDIAKAVWAGMQEGSVATLTKVQYLPITGPQTAANGVTYFNTLGLQHCTVVVAAGAVPVAAMEEGCAQFPDIKYVAVGGDTKGKPFTAVDAGAFGAVRAAVKDIVVHSK
jgi:hypothetical protein